MSRCKCCNYMLTDYDLYLDKPDGTPEDMCQECRCVVELCESDAIDTKEYAFSDITDRFFSIKS